jgi:D-tyrosyl-tRNA(Tyr) deacylase
MRAVVQRVKSASVHVGGRETGAIGKGLLVYLGVQKGDTADDLDYIARKLTGLRVFEDGDGKMNLDVSEAGGGVLVVSQFTLLGDSRKGRRPGFAEAAAPELAERLYKELIEKLRGADLQVEEGEFRAHMEVGSVNDGPVTMLLDSRKLF